MPKRRQSPERGRRRPAGLGERRPLDPRTLIAALDEHDVAYIIVGGLAAVAHGSQRITRDLDIIIDRSLANCRRLIAALVALEAEICVERSRHRPRVAADADPAWLASQNRFFDTAAGGLDVWNRAGALPSFKEARPSAVAVSVFGSRVLVLDRDRLIRAKLAAGREKDLADVAELGDAEAAEER